MNLLLKHNLQWRTTWKLSFGVGTVSILFATSTNKRGKDTNRTILSKSQKVVLGKHNADVIVISTQQVISVVSFIACITGICIKELNVKDSRGRPKGN
jgi:hypothetical protein